MGRGKRRGVVSLGLTLVAAGSAAGLGILALTVAPTVVIGEVRAADGSPAAHVPVSAGARTPDYGHTPASLVNDPPA